MESKNYEIIRKSDWKVTNWSGGTTSQLFIHPIGSDFKSGDYKLRISIASVEVEKSNFTPLKDVDRTLLVLEGNIELHHEGQHTSFLNQFEQDSFSGNWKTSSIGKVLDFNVMTKGSTQSEVRTIQVDERTPFEAIENDVIHVLKGMITIDQNAIKQHESIHLKKGSKLMIISEGSRIVLVRTEY